MKLESGFEVVFELFDEERLVGAEGPKDSGANGYWCCVDEMITYKGTPLASDSVTPPAPPWVRNHPVAYTL